MIIDNTKTYLKIIIFVLLLATCFYLIGEASADETITNITNNQESNITINNSYINLRNDSNGSSIIHIKESDNIYTDVPYITLTGKPSCGCKYSYKKWYTRTYINYCPNCHRYNSLLNNPKGVYEKEATCKFCSSDFCIACGKEKYNWSNKYLRK